MVIETKIRFEAGGVTITQTFGPGKASPSSGTSADKPSNLLPAGTPEEEGELGESHQAHGAAPFVRIPAREVSALKKKYGEGGEVDRPGTGGGGPNGALSGGLTIVFGSLITDCGTVRHISAQTDFTGTDKTE